MPYSLVLAATASVISIILFEVRAVHHCLHGLALRTLKHKLHVISIIVEVVEV